MDSTSVEVAHGVVVVDSDGESANGLKGDMGVSAMVDRQSSDVLSSWEIPVTLKSLFARGNDNRRGIYSRRNVRHVSKRKTCRRRRVGCMYDVKTFRASCNGKGKE